VLPNEKHHHLLATRLNWTFGAESQRVSLQVSKPRLFVAGPGRETAMRASCATPLLQYSVLGRGFVVWQLVSAQ
jgi:hypothetical protein